MTKLFYLNTPFSIKNLSVKNRIVMPPMCQYQAKDGMPNDWHFVHYVSRAVGGVGLIIVEMTNVAPNGRISPNCLGLWNDQQRDKFKHIVDAVHAQNAKIAIQIGHAGRKALGTDDVVAPSAIKYDGANEAGERWQYQTPRELTQHEISIIIQQFKQSVQRAIEAGFDSIELHAAHGYLIHQFSSPKSNLRTDEYGQDRFLFGEQVIKAAKSVMPADMPLIVRISAQEYGENGFDAKYGCKMAKRFAAAGADILHVSGGGDGHLSASHTPPFHAGYQVYLARAVKQATQLPVIAVGMLDDHYLADFVLSTGDADLIAVGRGLLRDPYWVLHTPASAALSPFIPSSYACAFD
ncbi:NADH:flavin oxidoreductase/NADH oxidase [Orbaceae bacterium ESL0727]|nr:NADH:flavin oxidoreductase/NADH oxidase [Orbaceae bacterium ESL0727]